MHFVMKEEFERSSLWLTGIVQDCIICKCSCQMFPSGGRWNFGFNEFLGNGNYHRVGLNASKSVL